jgi:uncharacterized membrane protein
MVQYVVAYFSALVVFLGIDFIWLAFVARNFYFERLGPLMLDQPNFAVAAIFYLFYVVGVVHLAIIPGLKEGSVMVAVTNAAIFGLLAYGTYDITNMATLKGWSWEVAIVDMIWGAVLTGTAAFAGYHATRFFLSN